ncbi:DUF4132 domain-containing protein [Actinomadura sp. 9N407]|uniref:DUF4132 domain-containing protein n=1 Tax=Actinomadura sp. 9N407 TaxID=3375154 RepID=UPI0037A847AC
MLEFPEWLLRELHPRRGGLTVPVGPLDSGTANALFLEVDRHIEDVLSRSKESDPAERARAYREGVPDPLGAAVVTQIVATAPRMRWDELEPGFVDAWVAEHGLPFAACAFAELVDVMVEKHRRIRFRRDGDGPMRWWVSGPGPLRLRALLASADDAAYAETVRRLADHRRSPLQRVVAAYLVPTRQDWVDDACATPLAEGDEQRLAWLLLCSLSSARQLDQVRGWLRLGWYDLSVSVVAALVEGVGSAGVLPLLTEIVEGGCPYDLRSDLLRMVALLPEDEPFQYLVDRLGRPSVREAVIEAMEHFPERAVSLLAPAAKGGSTKAAHATDLLRAHLVAHPELLVDGLPESVTSCLERVGDVPAGTLPALLTEPPWTRTRKAAKPVVLDGLAPPAVQAVRWAPGERERWAGDAGEYWRHRADTDWKGMAKRYWAGRLTWWDVRGLLADGPEDLVRPILEEWRPDHLWGAQRWAMPIVARFEGGALPFVLRIARANPANAGLLILPFLDAEAASLAAGWLARLTSARAAAREWFDRHGLDAVPPLLPAALGKPGVERRSAETALRYLATGHGDEPIVEAARHHGDRAADAVATMLATDPLDVLPAKVPRPGAWADPALLPQILIGGRALPAAATGHFLTMLAMSKPGDPYPGIEIVRGLCDAESLARFSWAVFHRWELSGAPAKDGWALTQLGWLGDDEAVRRLSPLVRAWPGEGGHKKAVAGLDVLAGIGSDVALMHLNGIAQKVKFKGLKARAQERIDELAAGLGLTPERLADRLVPDLGLTSDGSLTLDYGPRRFTVGFDEQLTPYVNDGDGKHRKALPKPGAKDDEEQAPAAYKRFTALKKDVRTIAADQIRRLETAMVTGRRWTVQEFADFFVGHPLVQHIARRLVWATDDGTTFRIAEDGTFADIGDEALVLPDAARVRIRHPVDLDDGELTGWSEMFADYEILQPFPQLARAVHALTEQERDGARLERFEGRAVPVGKVVGLERRGWRRGDPQDAGVESWISRQVADDRFVVIGLDPGIIAGAFDEFPEQTLYGVRLTDAPHGSRSCRFGDLDRATASEILADLLALTDQAT